jgi:hypothetical protein
MRFAISALRAYGKPAFTFPDIALGRLLRHETASRRSLLDSTSSASARSNDCSQMGTRRPKSERARDGADEQELHRIAEIFMHLFRDQRSSAYSRAVRPGT